MLQKIGRLPHDAFLFPRHRPPSVLSLFSLKGGGLLFVMYVCQRHTGFLEFGFCIMHDTRTDKQVVSLSHVASLLRSP